MLLRVGAGIRVCGLARWRLAVIQGYCRFLRRGNLDPMKSEGERATVCFAAACLCKESKEWRVEALQSHV